MAKKKPRKYGKAARTPVPEPAPGDLEIIQAFVNTASPGDETDELASPEALSRWLVDRGLLAAGTILLEPDLRRAVAVREGLRALLAANNGVKLPVEAVRRLREATEGARFRLRLDDDGAVALDPVSLSFEDALAAFLGIASAAQNGGHWQHFKACALSDCRRAFFDASRSRARAWCTKACGNRERSRAFRRTDMYKSGYRSRLLS